MQVKGLGVGAGIGFVAVVLLTTFCKNPTRDQNGNPLAAPGDAEAGVWFCSADCLSGDAEAPVVDPIMEQNADPEVAYAKMLMACNEKEGAISIQRQEEGAYTPGLIGDVCRSGAKEQAQVCAGVCQSTFRGGENLYRFVNAQSYFAAQESIKKICQESQAILLADTLSCLPATSQKWTCSYPCRGEGEAPWEKTFVRTGPSVQAVFGQLMADCATDAGNLNLRGLSLNAPYRIDSLCLAR